MLANEMNRTEPREDARLNRQRLIDAARDVFRERGVAAEMREIAERAGLAVGTIYRNYPSKDDLILALLDDAIADVSVATNRTEASVGALGEVELLLGRSIELADRYGWLIEAYLGASCPTAAGKPWSVSRSNSTSAAGTGAWCLAPQTPANCARASISNMSWPFCWA
jgi:AcrR family transcriptional regulator